MTNFDFDLNHNGNAIPVAQNPFENALNTGRMVHQTLNGLRGALDSANQGGALPVVFALGALGLFIYNQSQGNQNDSN